MARNPGGGHLRPLCLTGRKTMLSLGEVDCPTRLTSPKTVARGWWVFHVPKGMPWFVHNHSTVTSFDGTNSRVEVDGKKLLQGG